jgi:uncharacterized membrane protein YesL
LALFKNINNSGKGISRSDYRKKGVRGFFDVLFRKAWKLFLLNMLYMAFFLPAFIGIGFVTNLAVTIVLILISAVCIGPATGGFFRVLRSFTLEEPIFMAHTFFKVFKKEFGKNFFWGIINIIAAAAAYSSVKIYPKMLGDSSLKYVLIGLTLFVAVTALMMNFYYFLITSSIDLSLGDSVKDSFILVTAALKTNLISLLISVLIWGVLLLVVYMLNTPLLWFIFFFTPASVTGLIITFNTYPVIQKYIINPYYREKGELNPELEYEISRNKALFEDMGGKEKVIRFEEKTKKKRSGGRDIS